MTLFDVGEGGINMLRKGFFPTLFVHFLSRRGMSCAALVMWDRKGAEGVSLVLLECVWTD